MPLVGALYTHMHYTHICTIHTYTLYTIYSQARTFDEQSRSILKINTLECVQNSNCPLLGLEVRDSDLMESPDGAIQVTLVATNGTLSLDPAFTNMGSASQMYVLCCCNIVSVHVYMRVLCVICLMLL